MWLLLERFAVCQCGYNTYQFEYLKPDYLGYWYTSKSNVVFLYMPNLVEYIGCTKFG